MADLTGPPTLQPGADIAVEGFDQATGHTLWTIDAGANVDLSQQESPPQTGPETVILPNAAGTPDSVDLATGKASPIAAGTVAFCQKATTYTGQPHDTGIGTPSTEYFAQPSEFPCDPTGRAVPLPSRVPTFLGPTLGGVVAFSEANAVVAEAPVG